MLIAVAADGRELNTPVSEKFSICGYLLFVETDSMLFEAVKNNGDSTDEKLAEMIVNRNCEAVIMGEIPPRAFAMLANEGVTRYSGVGLDVKTALQRMNENALEYICSVDGSEAFEHHSCGGDHEQCDGSCDECE